MALLTTYGPTNLIEYEPETTFKISTGFFAPAGVWYEVFNEITIARYAYVGMTKAAAVTCATALNDPANGINARPILAGGAGMYSVEVDKYVVVVTMEAVTP